ncbi:hypothetical protein NQZ68_032047 [Dissostichus eleginoides]|nr:hypothetical protein NQZ68_032047 [Dissostichus eleginoides]
MGPFPRACQPASHGTAGSGGSEDTMLPTPRERSNSHRSAHHTHRSTGTVWWSGKLKKKSCFVELRRQVGRQQSDCTMQKLAGDQHTAEAGSNE